jgi:hypothetical protein
VVVQLLAVARDEQEGVVGRRTDDQDRQDPLALPVQGDRVAVGQRVDHERRQREPEGGGEQGGQRQQRAAVDQQQDDEDRHQADQQQLAVDPPEGRDQVGQQPARTGDVDPGPGRLEVTARGAQRLGDLQQHARAVRQRAGRLPGVELHRQQQGLAVLAGHPRDRAGGEVLAHRERPPPGLRRVHGELQVRHPGRERRGAGPVGGGQSRRPLDHDEVRQRGGGREPG